MKPRDDLFRLVRGIAHFTGDLPLPAGTLHAMVATSPHAHARVSAIDSAAALAEPGVLAVLTAADIPGVNDVGNLFHDEPMLADGIVHCVGQPYALVLADTFDAAWRGAAKITADWDILPAVFDAREAFAAGDLIQPPRTFALGDIDDAWSRCTTIVRGRTDTGAAEHVYLETQCALAIPRDDGGLRLHSATQSPSVVQQAIAAVLGLPMHAVEVDVARLGGGFGGKEDQATLWACLAAFAAQHAQRPVRLCLDRHDDIRITGKRHPYAADFRLGLDADGRFLAYEAFFFQNAGATADLSTAILERSLFHATNAYFIPNVRVTAASCRTNLPSNTAFRGFGAPQAIFVIESAIRAAARERGVPASELQARNLLQDGDVFPYGMRAEQPRARACWQALEARHDIAACQRAATAWNAAAPRERKGVDVMPVCFGISFTATLLNQAEALVHVYGDGSVAVTTGAVEMGQGVHARIRAIVARTLGIDEARVRIESTSTTRVANVSPTAASTGADLNGAAAREACLRILDSLARVPGGAAMGWLQRVAAAYAQRLPLSALAHYATPGLHFDRECNQGRPFAYHVYGAAIIESTVDTLRGTGRIDRIRVVHDIGRSLDETIDRGQVEGAIIQGLGWMTCEDVRHDAAGRLLTDTLATYKIPDLDSAPPIDVCLLRDEGSNPDALGGSKAVGEPPLVYGLGAFFALRDAIQHARPALVADDHAPMTPERILGLLYDVAPPSGTDR